MSKALNNVLATAVDLVNSVDLAAAGRRTGGSFDTAAPATTPVLDLFVAPVHLDLLGAGGHQPDPPDDHRPVRATGWCWATW